MARRRSKLTTQIEEAEATLARFEKWRGVLWKRRDEVEAEMEPLRDHKGDPKK